MNDDHHEFRCPGGDATDPRTGDGSGGLGRDLQAPCCGSVGFGLAEWERRGCSRRSLLKLALLAFVPWGLLTRARLSFAAAYPETIAALQHALQREMEAHQRYVESAGKARAEGYKGVAYLFTAFATSEKIHARNFERIMTSLGGKPDATTPAVPLADTKQNLITAANDELDTIDNLYPETLKRLEAENHAEAIAYVGYALQSEKQHRDMIQRVQRYTEGFFDRVVKAINEMTTHYYVCQVCGSTQKKIPTGKCPTCQSPSSNYSRIDAPA